MMRQLNEMIQVAAVTIIQDRHLTIITSNRPFEQAMGEDPLGGNSYIIAE